MRFYPFRYTDMPHALSLVMYVAIANSSKSHQLTVARNVRRGAVNHHTLPNRTPSSSTLNGLLWTANRIGHTVFRR
jgi:hypothetical protein